MDCRAKRPWSGADSLSVITVVTPVDAVVLKCGHLPCPEVSTFKLVNGPLHPQTGEQEHVVAAAAGITFTLFLTVHGKST